uniref:Uncharacterized protein n=1 Tax=Takifugu rubripes TaxID=31033 RepID=A0A3B5K0D6_TAKRU
MIHVDLSGLAHLLLAVPEVALALQPLELAEGGRGVLVEALRNRPSLLGLADQDGVTPEHHGHVFDLVSVDPRQDFGPAGVGAAVGDSVQRVQVDGLLFAGFVGAHPDTLRPHR